MVIVGVVVTVTTTGLLEGALLVGAPLVGALLVGATESGGALERVGALDSTLTPGRDRGAELDEPVPATATPDEVTAVPLSVVEQPTTAIPSKAAAAQHRIRVMAVRYVRYVPRRR